MPLSGSAAMLLSFDVVPQVIAEHDDWHTHEHLPERLAIPGFFRGTRWVAVNGEPRYFVMYEVEQLGVLTSRPYLERLNNPSAWTAKLMPHYRGMTRSFCLVVGSFGLGMGGVGLVVRLASSPASGSPARNWLQEQLSSLPGQGGVGSVHWFEAAATPEMTAEQRIRGADATVNCTLLITGYSVEVFQHMHASNLMSAELERRGVSSVCSGVYRLDYSLTHRELNA